jgi:hypothetical protein
MKINVPQVHGSYFRELTVETILWVKILKFFDADPGFGKTSLIRNTELLPVTC